MKKEISNVLVVLYGLSRGKDVSKDSYKRAIIDPLMNKGHKITCLHVMKALPRAGASGPLDIDTARQEFISYSLNDKRVAVAEKELSSEDLYQYSKRFRDKHSDNYLSNKYLIHQLKKLELSTRLVEYNDYDIVILVRDDLYFYNETLNWDLIFFLVEFGPVVSKWFWNGGASERFVVAKPEEAKKVATRIILAKAATEEYGCLNGEYLQKHMFDFYKIIPFAISLRFCRVRYYKKLHKEKYIYPIWRPKEIFFVARSRLRLAKYYIKFLIQKRRSSS